MPDISTIPLSALAAATANVSLGTHKAVSAADPASAQDLATKAYVDGAVSGGGMTNPMTTLGDLIYENASPAATRLAGNTTTTKKFLTQTGSGSASAAPAWGTIVWGDVSALAGSSGSSFCIGNDSRLSDARTPTAHATSHKSGGTDSIKLNELAAPNADVTLNSHKITSLADPASAQDAATKAYVDGLITGLLSFQGSTDCSGNPNYPAAVKGDTYVVSVAGKIGGASGVAVDAGDWYVAEADNAGGTEGSVGASWGHIEHNLTGGGGSSSGTAGDVQLSDGFGGFTSAGSGVITWDGAGFVLTINGSGFKQRWTDGTTNLDISTSGGQGHIDTNTGGLTISIAAGNSLTVLVNGTNTITIDINTLALANGYPLTMGVGSNIVLDTATGTKLGTGAGQKLGFWGVTPVAQQTANAALTDSTGGSASTTLAAVSGTGDDTNVNDNFAALAARLAEIRALLTNTGLGS